MRVVGIVQARMGSTRLPGKVLAEIHGKPLLKWLLDRLFSVEKFDEVVVATTTSATDDVLVEWLRLNDVQYYRGAEHDVLDRYYKCAIEANADLIVRVTADDPLKDPSLIEQAISLCVSDPELDYASNTLTPTFPEGLDIEVIRLQALELAQSEAKLSSEREHVTPYIWSHPEVFNLRNFTMQPDLSHWRWTVDKPEDLEFIRHIYGYFTAKPLVNYIEVIDYIMQNQQLMDINRAALRNEGYLKSVLADQK